LYNNGFSKEDIFLDQIELNAKIRTSLGNGPARTLRREGRMPAVLYGRKTEPILLSINVKEIEQILKTASAGRVVLSLVIQNGKAVTKAVMIKELQTHPVSRKFLHVDFYEIDMERKIRVKIPIVAKGKAKGIEDGGVLEIVQRELEVLCLPNRIPEAIELDVTGLDIGDSLHVDEIQLESGIEIPADVNFTLITVLSPKVEVELEEEEEVEAAAEAEAEEVDGAKETPEAGEE
jgi:large subunit ribosomal protein L25